MDPNTRDVLFLSAIVDIYDQIELLVKENKILREETRPAVQFSKTSLYFLTVVGVAILGFIGALLTHRVELVFK